jgi:hypothetical protein
VNHDKDERLIAILERIAVALEVSSDRRANPAHLALELEEELPRETS